MAYKIKIKHDIEGKTIPLHLKYNSNDNLPEIAVNLTDTEQIISLDDWTANDNTIDVEKIIIEENQIEEGDKIYKIESVINLDSGGNTAVENVVAEETEKEVSIDESTAASSNQEQIISTYNTSYNTGGYNLNIGELVCTDETKHLYDRTYDIRHTNYNMSHYNDDEFNEEYGVMMNGAFLAHKTPSGYRGRVSYTSIYYGPVLIEANSQYARYRDYEKSIISSQSINEEGQKNGSASYGLLKKEYRLCAVSIRIPDKEDDIVNVYTGPDSDADILSISFAPDYTTASTAYSPCTGNIYVNGTKVATSKKFVRVRLQKNTEYVISADNIKFMNSTDWNTLGNHYVSVPLYSDNILKIVVFNENKDHGIYSNLYSQARQNNWGLPSSMFRN